MSVALLFGIGALICAALSFWKPQLHQVATILLSIAVILMCVGANARI